MKTILFFAASLCFVAAAWAQTPQDAAGSAKIDVPVGPLLRPAANFSQWGITFTYADEKKKKESAATSKPPVLAPDTRLRKTAMTKTGDLIHEEQTDSAGRTADTWFDKGTAYTKSSVNPTWSQATVNAAPHPGQARSSDCPPASGFRSMEVVNASNYACTMPYGSGTCLVFASGSGQKSDGNDPGQKQQHLASMDQVAYIDTDSRLPIALRTRGELQTYHFDAPPTAMQTLPADLADLVKKGQEARARLEAPAARPF